MTVVRLGPVAHGGTVVGRLDGKVVFVSGGLPGELVRVEITGRGKRFDRGQVIDVMEAASGRVEAPCPNAGQCGGCDWQHADAATQLQLKTAVVAEQLRRLAGVDWKGDVEAVAGGLLGWRTRMRYLTGQDGRVGLRARRSHALVELPEQGCLIADPSVSRQAVEDMSCPGQELLVTCHDEGVTYMNGHGTSGPDPVRHTVLGRTFEVAADGFWQVHPRAAETLVKTVLEGLQPQERDSALDLYCGVGLFAGALVDAGCQVIGTELDREAVRLARRNVPEALFHAVAVERSDARLPKRADVVVLDPPRQGAGSDVVAAIASREPRAVAYVACDPAALARDLRSFCEHGYALARLRAFDLFPMTHHIECVAILRPAA